MRLRRQLPARYVQLGELQDTFLISAVGMILVIRLQLFLTNYPKLGGGNLHIAHLLYGGLLMMIALAILFSLVGRRWRQPAAVLGGAGFGFFIDEVGKFVTSDNNYFFKPSAAIIYIFFIVTYLVFRWSRERRGFSAQERVASALDVFTDATVREFNEREKRQALELLEDARRHPLAGPLRTLIEQAPAGPDLPPSRFARFAAAARERYDRWSRQRWFRRLVIGIMATYATLQGLLVLLVALAGISDLVGVGTLKLDFTFDQACESVSEAISGILVLVGLARLLRGRTLAAYKWFDRALIVQIFFGQVFAYINDSFVATWGFLFCVALLVSVRFMARQELRLDRERGGAQEPLGGAGPRGGPVAPRPAGASVR